MWRKNSKRRLQFQTSMFPIYSRTRCYGVASYHLMWFGNERCSWFEPFKFSVRYRQPREARSRGGLIWVELMPENLHVQRAKAQSDVTVLCCFDPLSPRSGP